MRARWGADAPPREADDMTTRAERAKRATQVGLPRQAVGVKPAPIRPNVAVGELA